MQVQVNTDQNIEGQEHFIEWTTGVVEKALRNLGNHVTRVEVHLADENGEKSGQRDKRCMMEARLEGRKPTAVTHNAPTSKLAVEGAADKLARVIEGTLGRASMTRG